MTLILNKDVFFYVMEWRMQAMTGILNPSIGQTQNIAQEAMANFQQGAQGLPPEAMAGGAPQMAPEGQAMLMSPQTQQQPGPGAQLG